MSSENHALQKTTRPGGAFPRRAFLVPEATRRAARRSRSTSQPRERAAELPRPVAAGGCRGAHRMFASVRRLGTTRRIRARPACRGIALLAVLAACGLVPRAAMAQSAVAQSAVAPGVVAQSAVTPS